MTLRYPHLGRYLGVCGAFLGLHAAGILFFPAHPAGISSPFLMLGPAIAAFACLLRGLRTSPPSRRLWTMLSVALIVWDIAAIMSAREQFLLKAPVDIGAGSEIVYFLYGVPILLAITLQTESSENRLFLWLDGIQVAIVGFLTYMVIFDVLPFAHQRTQPVTGGVVMMAFNVENLVLACASTLRWIATPANQEQRRFYKSITFFLWSYAVCAAVYNHVDLTTSDQPGLYDLIMDLPFLMLAICACLPVRRDLIPVRIPYARTLALLLDNGSPLLFPATVLALGIFIARRHFWSGTGSIALALSVYGVRSMLLQVAYHHAQAEARAARDHMEIISLTDPLTGVSNRRHFDQLLESEWSRLSNQPGTLSLLSIDIDHFKLLNDTFGHRDGDVCLRQVAHALKASLQREPDVLARYGGEEFVVMLPGTDMEKAEVVARRMRGTLASLKLRNRTPIGDTVTVSIGIATCHRPGCTSVEALFEASDRALYRAKLNGRDRVEHEKPS